LDNNIKDIIKDEQDLDEDNQITKLVSDGTDNAQVNTPMKSASNSVKLQVSDENVLSEYSGNHYELITNFEKDNIIDQPTYTLDG